MRLGQEGERAHDHVYPRGSRPRGRTICGNKLLHLKDGKGDELHERTKEGILEGTVREVSPQSSQRGSDKGKRNTSRQGEQREAQTRARHGTCAHGVHGKPRVCRAAPREWAGELDVLDVPLCHAHKLGDLLRLTWSRQQTGSRGAP